MVNYRFVHFTTGFADTLIQLLIWFLSSAETVCEVYKEREPCFFHL